MAASLPQIAAEGLYGLSHFAPALFRKPLTAPCRDFRKRWSGEQTLLRVYLQPEAACSQEVPYRCAEPLLTSHTASLNGAHVGTQDVLTCTRRVSW